MKTTKITLKQYAFASVALILLITACVKIGSIVQPERAAPGSSFDVLITLIGDECDAATDYTGDNQIDCGYIGILMPEGWTVDQDEFHFVKTATDPAFDREGDVYADEDHAAALEAKSPAGRGYKWWGGVSDVFDMHLLKDIKFTIKILTDDVTGDFELKYVVGDKNDKVNMGRYPWYAACAESAKYPITIAEGTGIKNTELRNQIKVFPQIVKDEITVETPVVGNYTIKVLNVGGKTILKEASVNSSQTLNLSGNPPGVYIVSVYGNDITKNFKIILQ